MKHRITRSNGWTSEKLPDCFRSSHFRFHQQYKESSFTLPSPILFSFRGNELAWGWGVVSSTGHLASALCLKIWLWILAYVRHRITLGVFDVHPLMSISAAHASLYSLDIHVYTLFVGLPIQVVITLSFKPFVIESVRFGWKSNKYFLPFCGLPFAV